MSGKTIPERVGRSVRQLREGLRASQDGLAAACREVGLDWSRASVASLETGRRGLTAEELLLLPVAFGLLDPTPRNYTLADVVGLSPGADPYFKTTAGKVHGVGLLRLLAEGRGTGGINVAPPAPDETPAGFTEGERIAAVARNEAERHAAERLGVPVEKLAAVCLRLWNRGLTAERDARWAEARRERWRADEDISPARMQALRGHITRELLAELRRALPRKRGGR